MTDWKKALQETDRTPLLDLGTQDLTVEGVERTTNPIKRQDTIHLRFRNEAGEPRAHLLVCSGKSEAIAMARFMRFIAASAGYTTPEEYEQFDPNYQLPDAMLGANNEFARKGITVVGRRVRVHVSRGKDTQDGDFFRDVVFEPAPE